MEEEQLFFSAADVNVMSGLEPSEGETLQMAPDLVADGSSGIQLTSHQSLAEGLKSVGTLYGSTASGQMMSLPLVMSQAPGSLGTSQSLISTGITTYTAIPIVANAQGSQVTQASQGPVMPKRKRSRGKTGISPTVKQMIAKNARAKSKAAQQNVTPGGSMAVTPGGSMALTPGGLTPTPAIQKSSSKSPGNTQVINFTVAPPGGAQPATKSPSTKINLGKALPISYDPQKKQQTITFQTPDGQKITLPIIITANSTKSATQTSTVSPASTSNLAATQVTNVTAGVVKQTSIPVLNPQESTSKTTINVPRPEQLQKDPAQPVLTLQTTDGTGGKIMVPVMLASSVKQTQPQNKSPSPAINLQPGNSVEVNPVIPSVVNQSETEQASNNLSSQLGQQMTHMNLQSGQVTLQPGNVKPPVQKKKVQGAGSKEGTTSQIVLSGQIGQIGSQMSAKKDQKSGQPEVTGQHIPWGAPLKKGMKKKNSPPSVPDPEVMQLLQSMHPGPLIKCPCFCLPECHFSHHPLLVAMLNWLDYRDPGVVTKQMHIFCLLFEQQIQALGSIHEPIPDPMTPYQVPVGHWAAALGSTECLKWLINKGFKPSCQARRTKETPLHFALRALPVTCKANCVDKLQDLMPLLGRSALVPNSEGSTALHVAAELLKVAVTEKSHGRETGVSVQFYVKAMSILLTYMSEQSQVMMMRLINACNNRGDSVLHILGSSDDHFNVIALLVDLGADIHVRNVKQETVTSLAVRGMASKILTYLTSHHVKEKESSESGDSNIETSTHASIKAVLSRPVAANPVVQSVASFEGAAELSNIQADTIQVPLSSTNSCVIRDAAIMSQIATATSLISQTGMAPATEPATTSIIPSSGKSQTIQFGGTVGLGNAVHMSTSVQGSTPLMSSIPAVTPLNQVAGPNVGVKLGETLIPGSGNVVAHSITDIQIPRSKKVKKVFQPETTLVPPPNSHVIQFIPPPAGEKQSSPITVYVTSSDGKALKLTSKDLMTLTQALQAANIGKDKPSGPVQVILQQGNSNTVEVMAEDVVGPSRVEALTGTPDVLTLDDLTDVLKQDEHAGGLEFITQTEDPERNESPSTIKDSVQVSQIQTPDTKVKQQTEFARVHQNVTKLLQQKSAVSILTNQNPGSQNQKTEGQGQRRVVVVDGWPVTTAQQTGVTETVLPFRFHEPDPQLLKQLEAARKRPREEDEKEVKRKPIKRQRLEKENKDLPVIPEKNVSQPQEMTSEELVIKNLNGDEELFDYLKNCDLKTQRDVYNSLKEQYIQTQRDFNRLKATVSGADLEVAKAEEIQQDTVCHIKLLLEKLDDLTQEEENLTHEVATVSKEVMLAVATQAGLRERLCHCEAALMVLEDIGSTADDSRDLTGELGEASSSDEDEDFPVIGGLDRNRGSTDNECAASLVQLATAAVQMEKLDCSKKKPSTNQQKKASQNETTGAEGKTKHKISVKQNNTPKTANPDTQEMEIEIDDAEPVSNDADQESGQLRESDTWDQREPESPGTMPIDELDYQDLQDYDTMLRRGISSQASNTSSSSAQVVPNSQDIPASVPEVFYSSQGSLFSRQDSVMSSQSSLLSHEDNFHRHEMTILSSQEFMPRSEEIQSSQESAHSVEGYQDMIQDTENAQDDIIVEPTSVDLTQENDLQMEEQPKLSPHTIFTQTAGTQNKTLAEELEEGTTAQEISTAAELEKTIPSSQELFTDSQEDVQESEEPFVGSQELISSQELFSQSQELDTQELVTSSQEMFTGSQNFIVVAMTEPRALEQNTTTQELCFTDCLEVITQTEPVMQVGAEPGNFEVTSGNMIASDLTEEVIASSQEVISVTSSNQPEFEENILYTNPQDIEQYLDDGSNGTFEECIIQGYEA